MIETLAEFGGLIRKAREGKSWTLDELSRRTGISKPYLSNIETARSPGPPSPEKIVRLAAALAMPEAELLRAADWIRTPAGIRAMLAGASGTSRNIPIASPTGAGGVPRRADGTIDLDALVMGKKTGGARRGDRGGSGVPGISIPGSREMGPSGGQAQKGKAGGIAGAMGVRAVPLINRVAAGKAGEYGDLDYPVDVADRYVPVPGGGVTGKEAAAGTFALEVEGDSMEPEYVAGDILILSAEDAKSGDDCLVRLDARQNFATTFKRVYFEGTDNSPQSAQSSQRHDDEKGHDAGGATHLRLVPLNPRHATWHIPLERITGIYPVRWKMRAVGRGQREGSRDAG